jgi:hypothetical protein
VTPQEKDGTGGGHIRCDAQSRKEAARKSMCHITRKAIFAIAVVLSIVAALAPTRSAFAFQSGKQDSSPATAAQRGGKTSTPPAGPVSEGSALVDPVAANHAQPELIAHVSGGERPETAGGEGTGSAAAAVPAPKDVIGFTPGDDRKLAAWSQITDYFRRLAKASDRVMLQDLGKTTLGRPFLVATISSPANLAKLERYKDIQRKLADPRLIGSDDSQAEKLIAEGRTIVLITCGIHSTEVGGNLVSMNIAYRLASDDSAETREILDNCVIVLVPSLNPDGVDIVKAWYDKTLGTPSEGTSPPELYHHYTGHDNNRDWYAFTQVETQMTVDKVQNVWHPQIVHDIHQQGENGSRFFLPPYVDPWEPNVPPRIQAGVNFMGSTMAFELTAQGKAGVVIDGVYDAWSPSRAYQHYHGGIRILSETASARIASPAEVPFDKLTKQIGVDPKVRSWNFPMVWHGGTWKLSNIVDYMQAGAFALMRNAARYRDRWLRDFYLIGKDAVQKSAPGRPIALVIMPPAGSSGMGQKEKTPPEGILPTGAGTTNKKSPPEGILPTGAGTTNKKSPPEGILPTGAGTTNEISAWETYGLARVRSILKRGEVEMYRAKSGFQADGIDFPKDSIVIPMSQPYGAFAKTLLERQHYPDLREYPGGPPQRPYDVTAHTLPLLMGLTAAQISRWTAEPDTERITGIEEVPLPEPLTRFSGSLPRLAVYKNHAPSMDEGWTRWMFDQLNLKYSSIEDSEIRAGAVQTKFDCIVIPDQPARQLTDGLSKKDYPADIAGGLGPDGIESLKRFVEEGGTIITLNNASDFAVEHLDVPVKNVLKGIPPREFYCPGSILKIEAPASGLPIWSGVPPIGDAKAARTEPTPAAAGAWFETGPALEPTGSEARVVARFANAGEVLLSGWLLGADKIAGKAAIVEVRKGKGRIVMFAFRPQYRGQSWATLPFLLNTINAPG